MTNEEKFAKGIVIYKTDDDDYVLELWGASTKHPDSMFSMKQSKNFIISPLFSIEEQAFQWLLYCASMVTWKHNAKKIVDIALKEWYDIDK